MPNFRENRALILQSYLSGILSDEEFVLLYDVNTSKNPDFPYWNYERFDLDKLSDEESKAEFRFYKSDIFELADILRLPDQITFYNGIVVESIPAFCILLKRLAYPCRYSDLIPRFARPVPQLSIISNHMIDLIYGMWGNWLSGLNQPWLAPGSLQNFADSVHHAGAALDNCWGFVDGTVRAISRPLENQRVVYNGRKRVHSLKYQAVVAPNGLIANLYGPVEGKRHDAGMLADSGLLNELQQFSFSPRTGLPLCIYGDPAYPLRVHLQAPFRGNHLTQLQKDFNKSMSSVRVSVEWIFGDICNYFKFIDFKKNLKIGLSSVGKMYLVCGLLQNAHTCLYRNTTCDYFQLDPPSLNQYFI